MALSDNILKWKNVRGTVNELIKEMIETEGRVSTNEQDIANLKIRTGELVVDDLKDAVSDLEDAVETIDDDINNETTGLKAQVAAIQSTMATKTYVDNAISTAIIGAINANY